MFFSHTIKGQPHNMPMLKRMMELGCTLIDYERVVDERGRRLIFFGWHAGVAGMIETLAALRRILERKGISSPFSAIRQPFEYGSIQEIKTALDVIGKWIQADGVPAEITPLIIGFSGYGNVSRGAQEMLDILPVKEISPAEIGTITASTPGAGRTVFKVVFKEEHMAKPKDPAMGFSLQGYYDQPGEYAGIFEEYLPHLTMLVNCIYWDERYPRLVTAEYLRNRWKGTRLLVIGDISCDINGSIEVTRRVTDPGTPTFLYDVDEDSIADGVAGNGPLIMAVDILPSELPRDSSVYFSTIIKEFIPAIARADYSVDFEHLALPAAVKKAVILHKGRLTPEYEYIAKFLQ
jgi:alpha-aminoadipic semialdehyde synthase